MGGKPPDSSVNLEEFLQIEGLPDIYVLGYRFFPFRSYLFTQPASLSRCVVFLFRKYDQNISFFLELIRKYILE